MLESGHVRLCMSRVVSEVAAKTRLQGSDRQIRYINWWVGQFQKWKDHNKNEESGHSVKFRGIGN